MDKEGVEGSQDIIFIFVFNSSVSGSGSECEFLRRHLKLFFYGGLM